jgi:hypothetical protein
MQAENFDTFFDSDELGDTATISGADVVGMFERDFVEVNGVEGFYPTFLSTTTGLSGGSLGGTITISGASYKIVAKRPADETGRLSRLILNEA